MNTINWNNWKNIESIVIFGYGRQGKKIVEKLAEYFRLIAVVDNDPLKKGLEINDDISVIHTNDATGVLKANKVIVCAIGQNYTQIARQLINDYGLAENIDFMQHKTFITGWFSEFSNKCFILKTDVFLTSLCNLNCEKCASFIPYSKNKKSVDIELIKKTLDDFFAVCDYVFSLDLYGGEPLLYIGLIDLIKHIKQKYNGRIGYLGLITNGLIMPDDELFESLRDLHVSLSVSDYSQALGAKCKAKIDLFCEKLESFGIPYTRNRSLQWSDLGFPTKTISYKGKDVIKHRELCNTSCHVLYDNKLFYCSDCVAATHGELFPLDEQDYLDLSDDGLTNKYLQLFLQGSIDEDYDGFCSVCGGYGEDNSNATIAGRQI